MAWISALLLVLPMSGMLTAAGVLTAAPAAAAEDSTISLDKDGPGNVLAGGTAQYTLTASNPPGDSQVPQYNLSFRDQLPPGVSYTPGSTSPAGAGEPTVTVVKPDPDDDTTWYQVLTWQNVADLQINSTYELSFAVTVDEALHPVGTTLANDADAFTNEDARYEPKFDANGNVVSNSYTASDSASVTNTQVTAFQIAKSSSNSPEGELLRGIHDHVSTYTLEVTNNPSFPTDDIVITDYLPAGLEFLGCGAVDNSTDTALYPDGLEYPDAPPLSATPAPAGCIVPESVETVTGPIIDNGQAIPAGVFTKVTWRLGDFTDGEIKRIVYQAGIPQRANTTDWQGSPAPPTTADDGQPPQTANLDNNTGASTRESGSEQSLRNIVVGTGKYTGEPGSPDEPLEVTSSTDHTVTAEDLAMQKSVSPGHFQAGAPVTYTLALQTSEYVSANEITITDQLPDGVCPIWGTQTPDILPSPDDLPSECGAGKGADPEGATLESVTRNSDGTFTLVLSLAGQPLAANATPTVSYQGWMRSEYTGNGRPTAAGDAFTNHASVEGTTDIRDDIDVNAPSPDGSLVVHDESSATQGSVEPGIDKRIKPNTSGAEGYQCAAGTEQTNPGGTVVDPSEYVNPPAPPLTDPDDVEDFTFRNGSTVCFLLHVTFPGDIWTRNPSISDFLPTGTQYVPGSMTTTPGSTAPFDPSRFQDLGTLLKWGPGAEHGGAWYVAPGETFEVVFAATITEPATGTTPDLVGNLMKFRSENSSGQAISLRDRLDFQIAPLPPVSLQKGIATITPAVGGDTQDINDPDDPPANIDGRDVRAGDTVTFRVDVRNDSDRLPDPGVGSSVRGLDVMDLLPAGVDCSSIVAASITAPGVCLDPGDADYPETLPGTQSVIRWEFDTTDANQIVEGATKTLTYDFIVPEDASVGEVFTDTAGVRSYQAWTNVNGEAATYYPTNNIDPGACGSGDLPGCDAPEAKDPSNVRVVNVTLTKTGTTSITEDNNNTANQATIGELVTYTVTATVPYGSSVYRGVLTDALPAGLEFVAATANLSTDGGDTWGAVPGGTTGPTSSGQNVTLALPTSYTAAAASETDHVFRMTITARVTKDAGNAHGVSKVNTATFASKAADSDSAASIPPPDPATYQVTIVEPSPSLTKSASPNSGLVAGQTVTYTLRASNASGRPPLHDSFVVDCVPAGIEFVDYGTPTDGPTVDAVDGDGTNGCPSDTTKLVWQPTTSGEADGTLLGGSTATLTYTATVSSTSAGLTSYTNNAVLTGGTLDDPSQTDPSSPPNPDERTYSAPATATVTVQGSTVTKSVVPTSATIGQTATWTIAVRLPAKVNFYQYAVLDQVERGIDMTSVTTTSVTCVDADSATCDVGTTPKWTQLTSAAGANSSTIIGWGLGDVAAADKDRTVTITYTAKVANISATVPRRGDVLKDTATGKWDSTDQDDPTSVTHPFDKSTDPASANLTVLEPAMTITKAVNNATPAPGEEFTYTVTVRNTSGATYSTAYNVAVTDAIPVGVVVTNAGTGTVTGATADGGGTMTWPTITSLAPGASQVFTYRAKLGPSANLSTAGKTNTARVTGYDSLPAGGRHYTGPSTTRTVTPKLPKVTPTKSTPNGDIAYVNTPFTWQITLTNANGASPAYGVDAFDTLPPNWQFTAMTSVTVAGTAITPPPGPTQGIVGGQQTLTWTDLGTINANQTIVVTFTATPLPGALTNPGVGGSVNHTNTVATTAEDATGAQGSLNNPYNTGPATAAAHIHSADVAIDKSHLGTAVAGQTFDWTIDVTNKGPDRAVGPFTVTDTVVAPMTYVSASGTGWTCSATGAAVSCTRTNASDTLAAGASFPRITLRVAIPADTALPVDLTNTATVAGPRTYDPDPTNNTDTDTVPLTVQADLAIVKAQTGPLEAGSDTTYTLDVTNNGPSTSRAPITVSDVVPEGTTFVSASGPGWVCPDDGADITEITCTKDTDLLAGQSAGQITVVLAVDPAFTGELTNTGTVSGTTPDPKTDNNTSTVTDEVSTSADVAIEKTHDGDFTPGTDDNSYTFTVTNFGPSDAAAPVTVTDVLPEHLSWDGTTTDLSGEWTCSAVPATAPVAPARQTVTCTLTGGLALDETRAVQIGVAVATTAPASGEFENTAVVTSGTPDPNESNNTDTDRTEYDSEADLAIDKTPAEQTAAAGEDATWQLAVRNNGPSNSVGPTTVTDVLPDGTTYVSAEGTGWDCSVTDQTITCIHPDGVNTKASLPPITVVATIGASVGPATLTNRTSVDGPTPDPDPSNNSDTAVVDVVDEADLGIVKTFTGDDPVQAGTSTTFELAVDNAGPSDADNVVVTDELPAGLTLVSATGDGWTCSSVGQLLTCTRDSLAAGESAPVIEVEVTVAAGQPAGTITNTATVSSATEDTNPDNDESSDDVTVEVAADLSLVKSHDESAQAVAGQPFTYTLEIANAGPSDAQAPIVVRDELPAGMSYVSNGPDWTCTTSGTPDVDQVVECTLDGGAPLAVGATAPVLTVTTQIAPDVDPGGLTNTASVTSPTPDPNPDDNTDDDTITVDAMSDLVVSKSHTGEAKVGESLSFTLGVSNSGPSEARDVTMVDTLPEGLTFESASGDGWDCSADGQVVTCTLADPLAPQASAPDITLTVEVGPEAYPEATNVVVGSTSTPEETTDNNTAEDPVTVPPLVDLAIDKSHTETFVVGEPGTYLLTVTNNGPTSDPGPQTIVDTLPAGLSYVSATGAGWTCSAAGATVTCDRDEALAVGASTTVTLVVDVLPAAEPSVTNTATVSTPSEETTLENNTDSDPTEVTHIPSADMALHKSHTGTPVAGEEFEWTIDVENLGADPAAGPFTVTDTVEAPMEYAGAGGDGWSCSVDGAEVTCVRADDAETLAAGASFPTITLRVTIPSDTALPVDLANTATVTSGTGDPDLTNNTDTDEVPLTAIADLAIVKAQTGPLEAGSDATYTLDVTNNGPSTSRAPITVSDVVPDGTTFVSASGPGWTCPGDGADITEITCTLDTDLPAGGAAGEITVVLAVDSGFTGDLTNTGTVSGTTPDPDTDNNTSTVTDEVSTSADVAIEKTHDGDFTPGTTGNSYTFTVTNFGRSDAAAPITVTDTLPEHLSWDGTKTDLSGEWTCTADPEDAPTAPDRQEITCVLTGGLALDETRAVQIGITVATTAPASGEFENTAVVTSGTPDPNESNNTSTDRTEYDSEADLAIAKTPAEQRVVAGEDVTWQLAVTNKGPSNSVGPTTVTDVLPDGTTYVSAEGTGWDCSVADQTITCEHPDGVPAEGSLPDITVVATVGPSAGPATLTNRASVDGPTPDPDPTNNTDEATVTVVDEADLGIVKTFTGDDPVDAGATTRFELAVTNAGPSDADGVIVADELPAGLTLVSVSGEGWACDSAGQVLICTRDSLAAGEAAPVIEVEVEVDASQPAGTITNTAFVGSATEDTNPDNDESSDDVTVEVAADLSLLKSHDESAQAVAGQPFTFTLEVANAGPSDAQAPIVIRDELPAGMSYVSNGPDWTCTTSGTPDVDQVVECTRDGSEALAAGAGAPPLTITTTLAPDVDPGGLTNTASVTSPTPDPNPDNNTDDDTITVTSAADLVVSKSHTGEAKVGESLSFTLGVSNSGPSEARDVTMVDTLPEGLTYQTATGDGWECSAEGQVVTCTLADPLASETSAPGITLTVTVEPEAYPEVTNVVVGSTSTPEETTDNNTAQDPVTVPPLVDLAIDKSHEGSFTVGQQGTYLLAVTNNGPTSDPGPQTIVDTLPEGLTFVSGTGPGWTCSADGAAVTCDRNAALGVGDTTQVTLVVDVGAAAAPSVVNTATVSTPSEETTTENNTDTDPTEVRPVSYLTIVKDVVEVDGDTVTYLITVGNNGPNDTSVPIVVSDPMPDGLEFVSAAGDGWVCTGGPEVTCTYDASLPVGESASFELVATLTADPDTEITNVATVISGGEEEVSDDAVVVAPPADEEGLTDEEGGLAATGADIGSLVSVALLFLVVGIAAVRRSRREL